MMRKVQIIDQGDGQILEGEFVINPISMMKMTGCMVKSGN